VEASPGHLEHQHARAEVGSRGEMRPQEPGGRILVVAVSGADERIAA
jgi:hypothetical protein